MPRTRLGNLACTQSVILLASTSVAGQVCDTDLFPGTRQYGPGPYTATIFQDWDGDGRLDAAAIDYANDRLVVLQGRADGAFRLIDQVDLDSQFELMETGDFDGNGTLDLVVAHVTRGQMVVVLHDGRGGFAPLPAVDGARSPQALAPGDLDGDGDLDLITSNPRSYRVTFYSNDGNGRLTRSNIDLSLFNPKDVISADFDGDGLDDFAVGTLEDVRLYRSLGDFRYELWDTIDTLGPPREFTAADVDGDGDIDLVVPAAVPHVFLNDGAGGFSEAPPLPQSRLWGRVKLRDLNDDGILDVLSLVPISVMFGTGGGEYADPVEFRTSGAIHDVEIADVDDDGHDDLLVGSIDIVTLRGNGRESLFETSTLMPMPVRGRFLLDDFDRDGVLDALYYSAYGTDGVLVPGLPDGGFGERRVFDMGIGGYHVLPRDIDADGDLDLVVGPPVSGWFAVVRNAGDGTFLPPETYLIAVNIFGLDAADLDGDGDMDIAVSMDGNRIGFMFQDGAGAFSSPVVQTVPDAPRSVLFDDLDLDGDQDALVALSADGRTEFYLLPLFNDGGGNFVAGVASPAPHAPRLMQLADLDADGFNDVVGDYGASVYVQLSLGDGSFAPEVIYGAPEYVEGIDIGDVDLDGDDDVAIVVDGRGVVGILPNLGDGTFGALRVYDAMVDILGIELADVDRDGGVDVIVGAESINALVVLPGACVPGCLADLDGDGALTLFDFLAFQGLFAGGDARADFDGDGALTVFDFLAFQAAFDAGCE